MSPVFGVVLVKYLPRYIKQKMNMIREDLNQIARLACIECCVCF